MPEYQMASARGASASMKRVSPDRTMTANSTREPSKSRKNMTDFRARIIRTPALLEESRFKVEESQ